MDEIDPKDTIFLATALSVEGSAIWSNDKHLKRQSLVKCYSTKEIIELILLPENNLRS